MREETGRSTRTSKQKIRPKPKRETKEAMGQFCSFINGWGGVECINLSTPEWMRERERERERGRGWFGKVYKNEEKVIW